MKIHCKFPEIVKQSISLNIKGIKFTDSTSNADITLDNELPTRLGVILDGLKVNNIRFTEKEDQILNYLRKSKKPVSKEEMLKKIWNYSSGMNTNTIESHIYRLRQKLSGGSGKEIISTEGGNYKLIEK